jgi:GT2 family glycosyltransferase
MIQPLTQPSEQPSSESSTRHSARQEISISLVVPVFNRPVEVEELLNSLTKQTCGDFELVIVEDGSSLPCDKVVKNFESRIELQYITKDNSGPGLSRNVGAQAAKGSYIVFLDSDCVIPPGYVEAVLSRLSTDFVDAFGGPDKADAGFSPIQKAINYSMTSFFTTGGIRGGGEKLDRFMPRSFNMGISREVFERTGGFSAMRFGEDIDLSLRILSHGFKTALLPEAYVYHKRRSNLRQFFKQVYNSGIARIVLHKKHPGSMKLVHVLPAAFVLGVLGILLLSVCCSFWWLLLLVFYKLAILVDASVKNASLRIGVLAVAASFVQLGGYGLGFLTACWNILIVKKDGYVAFIDSFYH